MRKIQKSFDFFSISNYIFFAILIIIFALLTDTFLTSTNIYSTLQNGAPIILITCGITFALLTGIIDLSVAAVGYASGCLCGILIKNFGVPIPAAFLAGVVLAFLIGCINSLLIVKFKMNMMLTTLGMMLVIRSIGKIITHDQTILMGPKITAIRQIKIEFLGNFPAILIIVVLVLIISQVILKYTQYGRHLIAVGCNEKAARNIGINVDRVKAIALITCSSICGIAGIVWVITLGSVVTRGLNSYEFIAIASAVLGGTSLFGGRGSFIPGSFIGAIILLFVANGLTILGVSPYIIPFFRGTIIFIAMYADSLKTRASRKFANAF
jgi:ribose/xylose/arabinose/galactoside ABC-type transport system permease subunit